MKNSPKISIVEIVLITPFILMTDAIGIILVLLGLDDFFILDVIRFPFTQFYLRIKGVKGIYTLIANILETLPYVGALPIASLGWALTILADRKIVKTPPFVPTGKLTPFSKMPLEKSFKK